MARTAKTLIKIRNNGIDILNADTLDFQTGISATANGSVATISVGGGAATELEFIIDGGGVAIGTGQKGYLEIPFAMTITGWTLVADQTGSIVVDVWKTPYGSFPPGSGNTITGSDIPTISSAKSGQNLAVSAWSTSLSAGDILAYNVNSVSTVQRVTLSIRGNKN